MTDDELTDVILDLVSALNNLASAVQDIAHAAGLRMDLNEVEDD